MNEDTFRRAGNNIIGQQHHNGNNGVCNQRFVDFFGASPLVCSTIWNLLSENYVHPDGSQPKHMLAAFHFLRVYNIESVNRALFDSDEKTLRKWIWLYIRILATELKVVCGVNNRF